MFVIMWTKSDWLQTFCRMWVIFLYLLLFSSISTAEFWCMIRILDYMLLNFICLPALLCFTVREFRTHPSAAVAYLLLSQVLSAVTLDLHAAQAKRRGWTGYDKEACNQCRAREVCRYTCIKKLVIYENVCKQALKGVHCKKRQIWINFLKKGWFLEMLFVCVFSEMCV